MNAPLYNKEILRLAASIPYHERIAEPMASVEKRSPVCGSRVTVDVNLDPDGRVAAIGMLVRACALGQASSALMGAHVVGRTPEELAEARDQLTAWLAGERVEAPEWPPEPRPPHNCRSSRPYWRIRSARPSRRSRTGSDAVPLRRWSSRRSGGSPR